jgi:protein phosphatase
MAERVKTEEGAKRTTPQPQSVVMPSRGRPSNPHVHNKKRDTWPPPSNPPAYSSAPPNTPSPPSSDRPQPSDTTGLEPRLQPLFDLDDDDDDITMVGAVPEAIKALRQGYRKVAPPSFIDDRPEIEIHDEQEFDFLLVEELLDDTPFDARPKISLRAHGATDRGRRRKVNQDAALVMHEARTFMIADGMGGHVAGEVASALAVEVVETAIRTDSFAGEPNEFWPRLGDELARTIEMANLRIFDEATERSLDGMGTTATAARVSLERQRIYIAHVGDSRCYRIRDGLIEQLTEDHTVANLMGLEGPVGAQLSRAVGVEPTVEVDLLVDVPLVGDRYLLCTDGLSKMLPDAAILTVVLAENDPIVAVEMLIEDANFLGGRDNIGIVLIEVRAPLY